MKQTEPKSMPVNSRISSQEEPSEQDLTDLELDQISGGTDVVQPRDPATGLPSGKRLHKPFVITKEL